MVTNIYEAMGDLCTKHSDTHSSYGTRIQTGKLPLGSQKIVELCGKQINGRGGNLGHNAPLIEQDMNGCYNIQHMLTKHTDESSDIFKVGISGRWSNMG